MDTTTWPQNTWSASFVEKSLPGGPTWSWGKQTWDVKVTFELYSPTGKLNKRLIIVITVTALFLQVVNRVPLFL